MNGLWFAKKIIKENIFYIFKPEVIQSINVQKQNNCLI